jgi:hypothetical protein
MSWHLHLWTDWKDDTALGISEETTSSILTLGSYTRKTPLLIQERRCSICNLAKWRRVKA